MEHGFEIASGLFTAALFAAPTIAFRRPDIYELIERPYAIWLVATLGFLFVLALLSRDTPSAPPFYVFVYLGVLLLEVGVIHDILLMLGKQHHREKRDRV
jgi:hypothetical protein